MREDSMEEAFKQIGAYFNGNRTGYVLLVNTDDMDIYAEIVQRLEADETKKCVHASDHCLKNGLPDVEKCITEVSCLGDYVLIGTSQALMLQSSTELERHVDFLLEQSISGHALILLNYCKSYIEKFAKRDPRIGRRVLLIDTPNVTPLPQITLTDESQRDAIGSIHDLLMVLEKGNVSTLMNQPDLVVRTTFGKDFFSKAVYQVNEAGSTYERLAKEYVDIAGSTQADYGNEQQWKWLEERLKERHSLSAVVVDEFGTCENLEFNMQDMFAKSDLPEKKWLYWMALKVFGTKNEYLKVVLFNSKQVDDFEEHLYLDLADIERLNPQYKKMYVERMNLINRLPERLPLISKYCDKVGKYEKDAIYYLTDGSLNEEIEFVKYLSLYDYTEDEVYAVAAHYSIMLEQYLEQFTFDSSNTRVAEADMGLLDILSQYFQTYKIQKITNRIFPEFLALVDEFALERPFNKLRPRSSIVSQMNKDDSELFFFDALGVEYLSFIQKKCEEYGMVIEISVCHAELPSITEKNKEFIQYFGEKYKKIDALDELKHHSQIFDYEKRKEPIHLFRELEIIDSELRQIQSMLVQDTIKRAIIVSDHGASRLAVINEKENNSNLELDEKAQHSGRCCPSGCDPQIPCAAYEDGFAVLANYERFKGGRKANVEVHGGATLEEVVVPVITLMKKPENIEYCFTEPVIRLKQKDVATITLYCNVPMSNPIIHVEGRIYTGEFGVDKKHAKFVMPELKRSREYIAEVYEGEKNLAVTLNFKIQKSMGQENDLFGI
jgi:hypothetical protein